MSQHARNNPEERPPCLAAGIPTMSDIDREEQARQRSEVSDIEVIDKMIWCGGSFIKALGMAFQRADPTNRKRLKGAFPDYWAKYTEIVTAQKEGE